MNTIRINDNMFSNSEKFFKEYNFFDPNFEKSQKNFINKEATKLAREKYGWD